MPMPTERRLDLSGLKCPLPALRTQKALRGLPPEAVLVVTCTDPMAAIDVPNAVRESGDILLASAEAEGVLTFHIRRAAPAP